MRYHLRTAARPPVRYRPSPARHTLGVVCPAGTMNLLPCPCMPGPEPPPSSGSELTRAEKEKLLQKMFSLPHWIAVIRLFGYRTLSMDTAREQLKPIAKKFGKEPVADACEVLVEIVAGKEPVARLKTHIKHMAFQILGPEAVSPEPVAPLASGGPTKARDTRSISGADGKPVKQPRHHVLKKCEQ